MGANFQELGPRVDALESALRCVPGDGEAIKHIRIIATSLHASDTSGPALAISEAARQVAEASVAQLEERTHLLVHALRKHMACQMPQHAPVLLIGRSSAFMEALQRELAASGRETVPAPTAARALELLALRTFACLVLDLLLPDQDGRYLLEQIRSQAVTASVPVVVIVPKCTEDVLGRRFVPDVLGCFGQPADAAEVAGFIISQLQRARPEARDARRDPATGLLDRAAFCEVFEQAVRGEAGRPVQGALALLELDAPPPAAAPGGAPSNDAMVPRVAAVLSGAFRATDVVARWGPRQFAVLLPDEDQAGAQRAVEKVLQLLRVSPPAAGQPAWSLSGGLNVFNGTVSVATAMELAEHFLLLARSHGGNRLVGSASQIAPGRTAVLVSADGVVSAVLKKILEANHLEVDVAAPTFEAARQQLASARHRVMVLEEGGSSANGLEVLRHIRDDGRFHRLPVILLGADEQHAARALELGANDYLLTPFSPFVLLARVRHLLARCSAPPVPTKSILLAAASQTTLIITGTALQNHGGLRVSLASTASATLRRLAAEAPDILLLDPHFSDADLQTFLPQVGQHAMAAHTQVILVAAPAEMAELRRQGGPSVCGVIGKPYLLQNLVAEISALLPGQLGQACPTPAETEAFHGEVQRLVGGMRVTDPPPERSAYKNAVPRRGK